MVWGDKFLSKVVGVEPIIQRLAKQNSPYKDWTYDHPMTTADYARAHSKRRRPRPPGYTSRECDHGPPGRYPPNNYWYNGRPNGYPQTCPRGNPIDHHIDRRMPHRRHHPRYEDEMLVRATHPHPHIYRGHHRGPRQHHGPIYHDLEEDEYSEEEDESSDNDSTSDIYEEDLYSDIGPPSFIRTRHGHNHHGRSLPPQTRHAHTHHGHYLQHPEDFHHHGSRHGHLPPGYNNTRVPGFYPRDHFRTGHYEDENTTISL